MGAAIANHNPLNVKQVPDVWKGSRKEPDRAGHAVFIDRIMGLRAATRCLQRKYCDGKRTLLDICGSWAPASDTLGSIEGQPHNAPGRYAAFVAERLGVEIDQDLGLFCADGSLQPGMVPRVVMLLQSMAIYEDSQQPRVSLSEALCAIALHQRDWLGL